MIIFQLRTAHLPRTGEDIMKETPDDNNSTLTD